MSAGYTLFNSSVPIHLGNLFDNQAPLPSTFSVWVSWDSFNVWSSCSKGCFGRGKFPSSSFVRFLVLTDVVTSYDAKIRLIFFYLIDMLLNIQLKISYCRNTNWEYPILWVKYWNCVLCWERVLNNCGETKVSVMIIHVTASQCEGKCH